MKIRTDQKLNLQKVLEPAIIGAFFCFLYFYFGVGEYPDSITYMEDNMDREPLYPLILKLFRTLFGNGVYLHVVVLLQNVFAFLVTWYLYAYVTKRFRLQIVFRIAVLTVLLLPHLVTGIFTSSKLILTNAVLSEGITLVLYQLFFTLILKMLLEQEKQSMWKAFIVALVTVFARGHMMPLLLVWMLTAIFFEIRKGEKPGILWRRVGGIVLLTMLAFAIRTVGISSYHLWIHGYYNGNTGGNMTLLTNVLYSADAEDVAQLGDGFSEEEKELLEKAYAGMQECGWTYADAKPTVIGRVLHHEDSHDKIKFEILYAIMEEAIEQRMVQQDPTYARIEMDELAGRYMRGLLPKCIGNWLSTYFYVACGGFIRTVAVLHPVLNGYAVFIYIVAIGLMWYLFKKRKAYDTSMMMALVLLMILANVCATSLTIMCLSRYMIYNMSLFYTAGVVMMQELWRSRKSSSM